MVTTLPVDAATAGPQGPRVDPSTPSSDYMHSISFWKMASDILAGVEAMRAASINGHIGGPALQFNNVPSQRLQGFEVQSPYLPKFPNENWDDYNRRRTNAFLTSVYGDISKNLASKPFSKTCELDQDTSEELKKLATNIDGLGNNMHVFAADIFKTAMDKGITWIMPDYTKVPAGSTLADEREMGARAYWVHVNCEKLLAVYSKFLNGKEVIFHARIDEQTLELDGYEEKVVKRVRELNREPITDSEGKVIGFHPAKWRVLQEDTQRDEKLGKDITTWNVVDGGDITIGVIPLVPVILGKRDGTSWRVEPPLRDLAYMQVKLFQMENNLDCIKELAAFPMLSGNGIQGLDDKGAVIKVPVGPRTVLFAPPNGNTSPGSWQFIEPAGSSLTFLQADIDNHKTEMRDLGMQPLTASNLTVVTTSNVAAKAHNACQSWALKEKDALEQAWKITMMWLKQPAVEPVVNIYTDFGMEMEAGAEITEIGSMQRDGIISKKLRFEEAKRRGVIGDDVDYDEDQEQLATEQSNELLSPEIHLDPITGMPIAVQPQPGELNPPPKPPIKVKSGERVIN